MHERNNELEGPSKLVVDGVFYQEAQEIRNRTWRNSNPQWNVLQLLSRVQRHRHTHRATGPAVVCLRSGHITCCLVEYRRCCPAQSNKDGRFHLEDVIKYPRFTKKDGDINQDGSNVDAPPILSIINEAAIRYLHQVPTPAWVKWIIWLDGGQTSWTLDKPQKGLPFSTI